MSDPIEGQAATEPVEATATAMDPSQQVGQPTPEGITATTTDEETFFDPSSLSEDLLPAYKQMQRAFTKKTQSIAEHREKVRAYDEFMRDPQAAIQQLASQYGYSLNQQQAQAENNDWEPQSWDEVMEKATERARSQLMEELRPVLGELDKVKRSNIERVLDEEVPEWRQYEDEMAETLQQHPSLAGNPSLLARIALPQEVVQGKAMQQALQKLQAKTKSAQVGGSGATQKEVSTNRNAKLSFNEAYEAARRQLTSGAA